MEEIGLRVLVEILSNGNFIADVEESYTGSTTDRGGSTPRELLSAVFDWAGMDPQVAESLLTGDEEASAVEYFTAVGRRAKGVKDLELRIFVELT